MKRPELVSVYLGQRAIPVRSACWQMRSVRAEIATGKYIHTETSSGSLSFTTSVPRSKKISRTNSVQPSGVRFTYCPWCTASFGCLYKPALSTPRNQQCFARAMTQVAFLRMCCEGNKRVNWRARANHLWLLCVPPFWSFGLKMHKGFVRSGLDSLLNHVTAVGIVIFTEF